MKAKPFQTGGRHEQGYGDGKCPAGHFECVKSLGARGRAVVWGMERPWEWICSEKQVEVRFLRNVTLLMVQCDQPREEKKREWKERKHKQKRKRPW